MPRICCGSIRREASRELAEDTGGFLIRDTNDLSSAFRRIDEDNRFHYLLTYSPTNPEFDGKFRTIQVKVHRDGAQVFSRKGYIAVRRPASGFLSYEAAALAALDHGKPPNDFPIGASGYVFPDPKGRAAVPLVVHVKPAICASPSTRTRARTRARP